MAVWFITGCSSGFGRSLTLHALKKGDKVIATARNAAKIGDLKEAGAHTMDFDVTASLPDLKASADKAQKVYGSIDILVNNAGYNQMGGLEELSPEETLAQFQTNVFGLLNVCRAFLPHLRAQKSGVIANISSVGAWIGFAGCGLYDASKFAVTGFSETLALEVEEFGIKVCIIEPGFFRSGFLNPGHKMLAKNPIKDYDGSAVRRGEGDLEAYDNNQPGDIDKGARVIVDVLTKSTGKEIPKRLIIGSDCYQMVKDKCEETLSILEEWKEIAFSTDIDK